MSRLCRRLCLVVLPLLLLATALALEAGQGTRPGAPAAGAKADAPKQPLPRTDLYGDPLPPGALARMGSVRFRQANVIHHVVFSPDSKTLAVTVGPPKSHVLLLLDASTGKELRRCAPAKSPIDHLVFSPDGKTLLGAGDTAIYCWVVATGATLRQFQGHPGGIAALAVSPDGKTLAVGGGKQGGTPTVRLLDAATGKALRELRDQTSSVFWLSFSADGKRLASASSVLHAMQPDGRTLHISSFICFWDAKTGKTLRRFENPGPGLVVSADHKTLAWRWMWTSPPVIVLQDMDSGKRLAKCMGEHGDCPLFSPDSKLLATGGLGGPIRLWDTVTGKPLRHLGPKKGAGVALKAFSPDGKRLATIGDGHPGASLLRLWDVTTGKEVRPTGGHQDIVSCLALAPDGKTVATGSRNGHQLGEVFRNPGTPRFQTVRLWETCTGKELWRRDGHLEAVTVVCFSPDAKVVATGGEDKVVRLWETATGRALRRLEGHEAALVAVAFAADGKTLLTASEDGVRKLWEVAAVQEARPFGPAWTQLTHACFSPDGKHLALCGRVRPREAALQVARADSGKALWTVQHEGTPQEALPVGDGAPLNYWTVAFSPDGRLLASSESPPGTRTRPYIDHVIRLWEVATGKEILRIEGAEHAATALAFSPDGKTLASGHGHYLDRVPYPTTDPFATAPAPKEEATIQFWDVATGTELDRLRGHLSWTSGLAFSPDGKRVISAGADYTALVWDVAHLAARRPPAEGVTPETIQGLWTDLAGDAAGAYQAITRLSASPGQAVPLLRQRLRPAPPVDARRIARLLADLDSARFAVRQQATSELATLRELAVPALRQAVNGRGSLEYRRRLELVLQTVEGFLPNKALLRELRALAVLERIGTEEARAVLAALAGGAPESRLTEEARAALERLRRQPRDSRWAGAP